MTTMAPTIQSLIERDLNDEPQSVIKVDELRTLQADLLNYVLTDQLAREYATVFERVIEAARPGSSGVGDVGVWVSGFFGSGKSLFAKIAGHVLADTALQQETARTLFQRHLKTTRPGDHRLAELFQQATSYRLHANLVGFDIMSQHMAAAERNVGLIFLRTYFHSLGLSNLIPVAQAELDLQRAGKYDEFKRLYATRGDEVPWEEDRDVMTCTPVLAACLAELLPQRYASAELAHQSLEMSQRQAESQMGIEDVVKLLLQSLDERQRQTSGQETARLIFVADEVGAWAGRNLDRIEQVRAFVEALGRLGQGRIWLLVTSQEKLSDVLADQDNPGANARLLQRLEARFRLNIHLNSSEVGTVIADRVLMKKATARTPLEDLWRASQQTLLDVAARPGLEMGATYPAPDRDAFVADYPFLPYQLPAAADLFDRLRGVKVSAGARSMLKVAFDATRRVAQQRPGALVPWDQIFDSANSANEFADEQYLGSLGLAHLAQADDVTELTPLAPSRVLKALWLTQHNPNIPRTPRNLARLLVDHLDVDVLALEAATQRTLEALERRNYVRRDPATEQWKYLSLDEVTIEQMLTRIQGEVKASDVRRELLKLYEQQLSKTLTGRVTVGAMGTPFGYAMEMEGATLKGQEEPVSLRVVLPSDREAKRIGDDNAANLDAPVVTWMLGQVSHLEQRMRRAMAIERLQSDEQFKQSATDRTREQARQMEQEARQLRQNVESAIGRAFDGGALYYAGSVVQLDEATGGAARRAAVEDALRDRVASVYTRFAEADRKYKPENIDRLFVAPPAERAALDPALAIFSPDGHVRAQHALVEPVLRYLQSSNRTGGQDVMETFGRQPYGWPGDLLRYLAAALFVDGRIAASDRTGRRFDDPRAQGARQLFGTAAFKTTRLDVEEEALTPEEVSQARQLLSDLGKPAADGNEVSLKEAAQQLCADLARRAAVLERASAVNFPLPSRYATIPGLAREITEAGSRAKVTRALLAHGADLRVAVADLDRLETFARASGFEQYGRTRRLLAAAAAAGLTQANDGASENGAGASSSGAEVDEARDQLERLVAEQRVLDEWDGAFKRNRLALLDAFKSAYTPLREQLTRRTDEVRKTILSMPEYKTLSASGQLQVRREFLEQGKPLHEIPATELRGDDQLLAANEQFSIAHLNAALNALDGQLRQAQARVIALHAQERQAAGERERTVIWSPAQAFGGKRFKTVPGLEAAFAEELERLKRQIAEGKEIQAL